VHRMTPSIALLILLGTLGAPACGPAGEGGYDAETSFSREHIDMGSAALARDPDSVFKAEVGAIRWAPVHIDGDLYFSESVDLSKWLIDNGFPYAGGPLNLSVSGDVVVATGAQISLADSLFLEASNLFVEEKAQIAADGDVFVSALELAKGGEILAKGPKPSVPSSGVTGKNGDDAQCRKFYIISPTPGEPGGNGPDGVNGANGAILHLQIKNLGTIVLTSNGKAGGPGGQGGNGGKGGNGVKCTFGCRSGMNGGQGGTGGKGGQGGNGGNVTVDFCNWVSQPNLSASGGAGGLGGLGGSAGPGGTAGSGTCTAGLNGEVGANGANGLPGSSGTILLSQLPSTSPRCL
jgi:hypothetical protein